jgi:hypothetical protein
MILGRDHRMRSRAIGHAKARAEVVRIGHAVQHQQQRLADAVCLQLLQQFVQRMHLGHGLHASGHALVAMAASQLGKAFAVGLDQPDAGRLGAVEELAHARIAARGLVVDLDDGLGRGLHAHADGVEAEENFGGRHGAQLSRQLSGAPGPALRSPSARNGSCGFYVAATLRGLAAFQQPCTLRHAP